MMPGGWGWGTESYVSFGYCVHSAYYIILPKNKYINE